MITRDLLKINRLKHAFKEQLVIVYRRIKKFKVNQSVYMANRTYQFC